MKYISTRDLKVGDRFKFDIWGDDYKHAILIKQDSIEMVYDIHYSNGRIYTKHPFMHRHNTKVYLVLSKKINIPKEQL